MNLLFVVNNPKDWPLEIPGVTVVPARSYLTDAQYFEDRSAKVFNLCRSYKYQSAGYYVSLLAAARGQHPLPSLSTIQDLRSPGVARLLSEDLEELMQRTLKPLQVAEFSMNIFFGRCGDSAYDTLAWNLFGIFETPLLRADFVLRDAEWQLKSIRAIGASEVQESDHDFLLAAAVDYFSGKRRRVRRRPQSRYDLAILHDPAEAEPPSDKKALERFEDAAEALGFGVEFITKDDVGRVAEFDGLFIRETTAVNHHTFRIARRAEAEGLVVIDDSNSILKCTNKVYLAELLTRHKIPCPKTLVVHADNIDDIVPLLGLPVVLKQPDSAFSKGVTKLDTEEAMRATRERDARAIRTDRRARLPPNGFRLARRHHRRPAAVRVQVLHGAPPLADRPSQHRRRRRRLRRVRNARRRRSAEGSDSNGAEGRQPDRRRPVRRRPEGSRQPAVHHRGERQPEHRHRLRRPAC